MGLVLRSTVHVVPFTRSTTERICSSHISILDRYITINISRELKQLNVSICRFERIEITQAG